MSQSAGVYLSPQGAVNQLDSPSKTSIDPLMSKRPSREIPKYSQAVLKYPDQLVKLFLGDSEQAFIIHKDFACHYSPVLRAPFHSDFPEGQTQEYRLQDTTDEAIRQLVNLCYTQKLDIAQLGPNGDITDIEELDEELAVAENDTLVEVWVLAEKVLIPKLQNLVTREMKRIATQIKAHPRTYLQIADGKTQKGSALRSYFMDCFACLLDLKGASDDTPVQMLWDIVVKLQYSLSEQFKAKKERRGYLEEFMVPED